MGETRVDLQHLLEDLRDAYVGALEETILTEIVANALDSGAKFIRIATEPSGARVTVIDDGSGMQRRDLARYHDIAASTKTRGQGIGFAGVGIKLALLLSEEVVTETRRGKTHVATRWSLSSRYRAPWKWISPPGRLADRGTSVTIHLQNALSPLLDVGYIENTLRRHFQPLFDSSFASILSPHYPSGIRFEINHVALPLRLDTSGERAAILVKLGRKRKPSAVGYVVRASEALAEDHRGVAISTMGKVIRRGWDWLGVAPTQPELVEGLIEAPGLAECLTLNKADFIRTGAKGALYLAYRKAIQEAVGPPLAAWGEAKSVDEDRQRRAARPVERDLERVLVEMAEDFPLLGSLVEHRPGGQHSLPMGSKSAKDGSVLASLAPAAMAAVASAEFGQGEDLAPDHPANESPEAQPADSARTTATIPPPGEAFATRGRRKTPQRYGLRVDFESLPDSQELGRLAESTVWINITHPAYMRAAASRSEGYHLALSVALALAPLAATATDEHSFVTAFLSHWGDSLSEKKEKRPRSAHNKRTASP